MALKYVNGDSSVGIKRQVPVFKNKTSLDEKKINSKVLKRIKDSERGLAFLK